MSLRPHPSRRDLIAGAAGTLALATAGRVSAQAGKPNIVFILADDLGYADVSCYGQLDYTTPNIDRLALEGMRFTQAYANSSVCSATRTALITGRYQYRLPVGLEEPINATTPRNIGLPPSHPTLPSLLRTAGYGTALVGKWHLGFLPDFGPIKSGYDHFYGIFSGAADYFNHGADASGGGGEAGRLYEDEVPVERHGYMTNLLGDRAVQTIEGYAASKQPFLLSLHFTAPHWPWEGPDDEAEFEAYPQHHPSRRRHPENLWQDGAEPGCQYRAGHAGAGRPRAFGKYHRGLHQRQWRRAVLQDLAVHRHEAGAARRRPSHPRDRALARTISRRDRYPIRP